MAALNEDTRVGIKRSSGRDRQADDGNLSWKRLDPDRVHAFVASDAGGMEGGCAFNAVHIAADVVRWADRSFLPVGLPRKQNDRHTGIAPSQSESI